MSRHPSSISEEYRFGPGISRHKLAQSKPTAKRLLIAATMSLLSGLFASLSAQTLLYGAGPDIWVGTHLLIWASFVTSMHLLVKHTAYLLAPLGGRSYVHLPRGPYLLEVDRYPDAPDGEYFRQFIPVGADSLEEAIEKVCENEGVSRDQILHGRELEHEETEFNGTPAFEGSRVWFDNTVSPSRSYSMSQYGEGMSSYFPNADGDHDLIHHSIAGYSNHSAVRFGVRTYPEIVAHHEIHELVHWALEDDEQPDGPGEEIGWHSVLWGVQDYIQDEQPDGPWFEEERRARIEATRPSHTA